MTWVPNWQRSVPAWKCARTDCDEERTVMFDGVVRRWCQRHAEEWDNEAGEATRTRDVQDTNVQVLVINACKMHTADD